jgi:hypothetical protein
VAANDDFFFALADDGAFSINGTAVESPHRIIEATRAGDVVVVLYDPDADPRGWGTFRNLAAFDRRGQRVWLAETPTSTTGDCYYQIASAEPLVAYSTQSFICTIDPLTGRITDRVFTK